MSGQSYEVPPLSRLDIRTAARKIRKVVCELEGRPDDEPYFNIVRFLELTLPRHLDGFMLEVLSRTDMLREHGDVHAMAIPSESSIHVREDVWQGVEAGHGRDRLTLAHELGHLVLHGKVGYARKLADHTVKPYRQSEWQADAFGGELLVAAHLVKQCASTAEVVHLFGVSEAAAQTQWRVFRKDGLI